MYTQQAPRCLDCVCTCEDVFSWIHVGMCGCWVLQLCACMHACLFLCMHSCMHTCMHVRMHMHASMHANMHACKYACMCDAWLYACMHLCKWLCVYVPLYVLCMDVSMHTCISECMCASHACVGVWMHREDSIVHAKVQTRCLGTLQRGKRIHFFFKIVATCLLAAARALTLAWALVYPLPKAWVLALW